MLVLSVRRLHYALEDGDARLDSHYGQGIPLCTAPYPMGRGGLILRDESGRNVKLTIHLRLALMPRMHEPILPFPLSFHGALITKA